MQISNPRQAFAPPPSLIHLSPLNFTPPPLPTPECPTHAWASHAVVKLSVAEVEFPRVKSWLDCMTGVYLGVF